MLIARLNKLESARRLQRADSFFMTPRLLLDAAIFGLVNVKRTVNIWGPITAPHTDGRRPSRHGVENKHLDNYLGMILALPLLLPPPPPSIRGVRGPMHILVTLWRWPESSGNTIHCNFMGKPCLKAGSLSQLPWQQSNRAAVR